MDLLACPFCDPADSAESPPWFRETDRVDRALFNKDGKRRKRIYISHVVECGYCGVQGPQSMCWWSDEAVLTEDMVERSKAAAALAWNARAPINAKAYELVSRIITEALGALKPATQPGSPDEQQGAPPQRGPSKPRQ